jgi:uncharacterized protein (DUF1015 family)
VPQIFPFRAIRYPAGTDLASVTAPPYDIIPPEEADRLELSHPHNIVRITLGVGLTGADRRDRYSRAAQYLREWLSSGILTRDAAESFYLYRFDTQQGDSFRAAAGLIAALALEPLGEGQVFGHEQTTPAPKADRLALMRATGANLEPLWFFASRSLTGFGELVQDAAKQPPVADLTDAEGIRHRLWRVTDHEAHAIQALSTVPVVVADGHHRYETALVYRDERRRSDGPGPWDSVLAMISDPVEFSPEILPTHRLATGIDVSDIERLSPFRGDLQELAAAVEDFGGGHIGVANNDGRWILASAGPLDTAFLQEAILEPLAAEVIYEHDLEEVEKGISKGMTAFIMACVPLSLVAEMALSGQRMPPKTTLFWPKPRSGLVMRDLEVG